MALVRIGTTAAIDAVASALLHGDEILRRAAAESLSLNTEEGYQILREGAEMQEDLEVRRAVCYGLGRIHQSWSEELLTKLQIEDDQWVVRNAASEMLEERKKKSKYIPNRLPPPSESPWLLAYAGKQGMGISPDVQPTDLLLTALKTGSPEEQLASLAYIRIMPTEGIFSELFNAMYGDNKELREAVYQTIAEMSARGINIPDPVQFGVGY